MGSHSKRPLFRVACLGDSHTHGSFGYNWVKLLRKQLDREGIELAPFAVNGELAYNARKRVGEVLAWEADLVVVLIGTNDVNARVNATLTERYMERCHLPERPSEAFFKEQLEGIVAELKAGGVPRIALVTLPLLGERLGDEADEMIGVYNESLREVAGREGCQVVELNAAMREALLAENGGKGVGVFEGLSLMNKAMLKRYLLFRGWDAIGRSHGLYLLTDTIHLNERSGRMLARLVRQVIEAARCE